MSTRFTVGLAEDTRVSSKVLKPPGGGSSVLFGDSVEESPRRVKNHQASNLCFGEELEDERKNGADSTDGTSTPSQQSSNESPDSSAPTTPRSGNPVTGEGYVEGVEQPKKEETPRRLRVPPGGFSSKLW